MKGRLLTDSVAIVSLSRDDGTLTIRVEGPSGSMGEFKVKAQMEDNDYTLNDRGALLLVLPEAGQNLEELKKRVTTALNIKS